MRRALELAEQGIGTTDPNPRVGAVIVSNGEVIGEGFHRAAGGPHAEIEALRQAGERARGATVYVTLEPCSHHGRTGPCADALIDAGVGRVVVGADDPNPQVAGKGYKKLRDAGIEVRSGVLEDAATLLNEAFLYSIRESRPFLHVKWAMTLDGKNGSPEGGRQQVSGSEARRRLHRMRAECDAVLIGGNTLRVDDPELTVREFQWSDGRPIRQPLRIVITNRPVDLRRKFFRPEGKRLVLFGRDPGGAHLSALKNAGIEYDVVPARDGIQWEKALDVLGRRELRNVLVEAGPTLAGAIVAKRLAQRATVLLNLRILGGANSRAAVGGPDPKSIGEALPLKAVTTEFLGDEDIMITGRLE